MIMRTPAAFTTRAIAVHACGVSAIGFSERMSIPREHAKSTASCDAPWRNDVAEVCVDYGERLAGPGEARGRRQTEPFSRLMQMRPD